MPLALISSQHRAWTLRQLSFFRHPLGRNVTHGRISIGDALAAAHLITPMGRISWISELSDLCSYWAINSLCMPMAMNEHLDFLKNTKCTCVMLRCVFLWWFAAPIEDFCGPVWLMYTRFNLLSSLYSTSCLIAWIFQQLLQVLSHVVSARSQVFRYPLE